MSPEQLAQCSQTIREATRPEAVARSYVEAFTAYDQPVYLIMPQGVFVSEGQPTHPELMRWLKNPTNWRQVKAPRRVENTLLVPLYYSGHTQGMIALPHSEVDTVAVLLADVMAARLDELYTANLTYRVRALAKEINQADTVNSVLRTVVEGVPDAFDYHGAAILKFEQDDATGEVIAEHPTRLAVGRSMELDDYDRLKQMFGQGGILVYNGQNSDITSSQIRLAMRTGGYKQFMAVPMYVRGAFIGALVALLSVSSTQREFTGRERELCYMLAQVISNAYINARRMRYQDSTVDDALFQQVIDEANVAIDIADDSGEIIYSNRAWEDMFLRGTLTSEKENRDPYQYDDRFQDDEKALRERVIFPKAQRTSGWRNYLTLRRQNGDMFDAYVSVSVLRDHQDRIVGYSTITDDVTDLHHVMESLQQQTARLAAASTVSQEIISQRDEYPLLLGVLRIICQQFNYDAAQVVGMDVDQVELVTRMAYTAEGDGRVLHDCIDVTISLDEESVIKEWIQSGSRVDIIDDVTAEPRFYSHPAIPQTGSELALLLKSSEGVLGALIIQSRQPNQFHVDDVDILTTIADQLAVAWQNAHLLEELRERVADFGALTEVSLLVQSSFELDELTRQVYDAIQRIHPGGNFVFAIYDEGTERLQITEFDNDKVVRRHNRTLVTDEPDLLSLIVTQGIPIFWHEETMRHQTATYFGISPDEVPRSFIGLPLIAKDNVLGAIYTQSDERGAFDENDLQFFLTMANSASFGLENMYLLNDTKERIREAELLNSISHTLAEAFGSDEMWDSLIDEMGDLFSQSVVTLALYDRSQDRLYIPDAMTETVLPPLDLSMVVIKNSITLHFEDLHDEQERLEALGVDSSEHDMGRTRSWIGTPLRSRNGDSAGVMCLQSDRPYAFEQHDLSLLNTLAAQVSLGLDNARLLESEQQRRQVANSLIDIGRVVTSTLNTSTVFERVLDQLERILQYDRVLILMAPEPSVDDTEALSNQLVIHAAEGFDQSLEGNVITVDEESLFAKLIHVQQPIVISSTRDDDRWQADIDVYEDAPPMSWIGVPMVIQSEVIGVITVERITSDPPYTPTDTRMVFALGRQAAIAVNNARMHTAAEANLAQLQTRARRLASLHRMAMMVNSTLEQDEILNRAAEWLTDLFNVDHTGIVRLDPRDDNGYLLAEYPSLGLRGKQIVVKGTPSHDMMMQLFRENRTVQITPDNVDDLIGSGHVGREIYDQVPSGTTLLAPMIIQDQILGSIGLDCDDPTREFSEDERETFMTMTSQVAMAINNARLYEQAVESGRLKGEFLANVSHELRTPLNAVLGYSELLLSGTYGDLSDKQLDRMQRIYHSGRNLLDLINDILDLSKIEAGRMSLDQTSVHVKKIIEEVRDDVINRRETPPVEIQMSFDEPLPKIQADPQRLRQIISNLLTNALKFTDEGYVAVRATTLAVNGETPPNLPGDISLTAGDWLLLEVEDTGIGISESDQQIIFDAFRQVDGSSVREYQGTGLGLAITRRLLEMQNGYIWLTSEVGVGSTFYVVLPTETVELPHQIHDLDGVHPLILLLDDDKTSRELLAKYMREDNYEVITTDDPQQLKSLAADLQPSIIVMDVLLPNADGFALLDDLNEQGLTAHIPVIIASIMDKRESVQQANVAAYLVKPVAKVRLLNTLEAVLTE